MTVLASPVRATDTGEVGERRTLTLPYSEVCMHMRIAGTTVIGEWTGHGGVQLYAMDGSIVSFPITTGEAGWGHVGADHTVTTFDENGRWSPR
jgi:hypothetical protein